MSDTIKGPVPEEDNLSTAGAIQNSQLNLRPEMNFLRALKLINNGERAAAIELLSTLQSLPHAKFELGILKMSDLEGKLLEGLIDCLTSLYRQTKNQQIFAPESLISWHCERLAQSINELNLTPELPDDLIEEDGDHKLDEKVILGYLDEIPPQISSIIRDSITGLLQRII